MEVTRHEPGTFCWAELATSDGAAAKKFYTGLFGWGFTDNDIGPGGVYTMLDKGGKHVGALYKDDKTGVPPHWTSYVSVASTDDTASKAKALGGTLLMEPFDVFTFGRMAVITDPTGATFCIWQPKEHIGAQVVDEVGAFCWFELLTRDTEKARAFYTGLGWGTKPFGENYTVFTLGDKMVAGMMAITPEMGDTPPNWMVYFQVADCDASAEQAKGLGARIIGPMDIPTVGRFAIVFDPQGAAFSIIKLLAAGG